jgi:hypothetical protein
MELIFGRRGTKWKCMEQNKYPWTKIFVGLTLNSMWNKSFQAKKQIIIQMGTNNYTLGTKRKDRGTKL